MTRPSREERAESTGGVDRGASFGPHVVDERSDLGDLAWLGRRLLGTPNMLV